MVKNQFWTGFVNNVSQQRFERINLIDFKVYIIDKLILEYVAIGLEFY